MFHSTGGCVLLHQEDDGRRGVCALQHQGLCFAAPGGGVLDKNQPLTVVQVATVISAADSSKQPGTSS